MSEVDVSTLTPALRRKHIYRERLVQYLNEFKNILIITVDFVGSKQMQEVRIELRGKAKILMGKNVGISHLGGFEEGVEREGGRAKEVSCALPKKNQKNVDYDDSNCFNPARLESQLILWR